MKHIPQENDDRSDALLLDVAAGLSLEPKEASVYLAVLKSGARSVRAIATAARTERTGTYDVLERLARRHLVRIDRVGKRTQVMIEAPDTIRRELQQRLSEVEAIVPRLQVLYNATVDNFSIEQRVGEAGLDLVSEAVRAAISPIRCSLGATSVADLAPSVSALDALTPLFVSKTTRVLVASAISSATREWLEQLRAVATVRSLPSPAPLPSSQLVVDDTVVTVGVSTDGIVVAKVVSRSLADHERSLFDLIWRSAKPIR